MRQGLCRYRPAEPSITNQTPHDGTILLLNPRLVVLLVCTRTSLLQPLCSTVVKDVLVHEGAVVVRVHAEHREGQVLRRFVQAFDHQHLVAPAHGNAFGPAAGDIGQREGVHEVTIGFWATTVLDHVDLEEARRRIAPVSKSAYRYAAPNGGPHTLAALALPVNMRARPGQHAINGRCADLHDLGSDEGVQIEVAVAFHGVHQHRDQRFQPFAAKPISRLPQHRQRLADCLVIQTVAIRLGLRGSPFTPQKTDGVLAVVAG